MRRFTWLNSSTGTPCLSSTSKHLHFRRGGSIRKLPEVKTSCYERKSYHNFHITSFTTGVPTHVGGINLKHPPCCKQPVATDHLPVFNLISSCSFSASKSSFFLRTFLTFSPKLFFTLQRHSVEKVLHNEQNKETRQDVLSLLLCFFLIFLGRPQHFVLNFVQLPLQRMLFFQPSQA